MAGVLGHDIAWELRLNLVRREAIDRALVQASDLSDEVRAFLDQFALWLLIQLMIQLALELLKFDHLSMLGRLYTIQSGQLVFSLRSQLRLYVLHKSVQLFDPVLLCLLNFLYSALHLTDIVLEVPKSSAEPTRLATYQIYVFLVNLFQLLELMPFVTVSKESTI